MADTASTIARNRTSSLSLEEQARGFSHKFNVQSADIAYGSGSSDTVTLTLGALPAKYVVNNALINIKTAFAGTTAMTVVVGTTTSTNASNQILRRKPTEVRLRSLDAAARLNALPCRLRT